MKRAILGVILLFAIGLSAMVWRVDDFESGSIGDINPVDLDGDSSNWEVVPSAKKSGEYLVRSESVSKTPDNILLFPNLYVELDAFVTFWVGAESPTDFAETYQVYIDFTNPVDPGVSELVWEETLTSAEWKKVEIDLKPFILANNPSAFDANINLGIRHYGSSDQSALLIDDIMTITYPIYLYEEGLFVKPSDVVEPYSEIYMQFYIYDQTAFNYETDWSWIGFSNVDLHYIITDETGTQPEVILPMNMIQSPDDEYMYYYVQSMEGYPMGTTMEYWVEATDNSGYNLVGKSEIFNVEWGEINFDEGFESGDLSEGWLSYQTGEVVSNFDHAWEVLSSTRQNVHSGEYSIKSESQSNFGVWETSNYLVTPRIRVNGTPSLKYFVNAETVPGYEYRERWSVLVSTVEGDGTDIENFVEIQRDSIIPTQDNLDEWYEKTFYMGDYKDQYVRIMWKHLYTSTATKLDRFLIIDDISLAEMPILEVEETGNAFNVGEDVIVNASATDYSGIDNLTIYYTIEGQPESSIIMTDNGDSTFTGIIPGQPLDTKCSWYIVVTDGSAFSNTTTSDKYDAIWFESGVLEWGSTGTNYTDPADFINGGDKVAIDWNFGMKEFLYLNKIEIGWNYTANNISWKLVEFDPNIGNLDEFDNPIGAPTDNVIGELQGIHSFAAGGDTLHIEDGKNTPISGHVGLVFQTPIYNEIMLDESGDKSHAWQWNSVTKWTTNLWGAFYIRMYVSQIPNGIEDEFVSSTTELCQNYPNPFNPVTSISFYNRIAGDVSLTVYNVKGENVAILVNGKMEEGFKKVEFDASKLNSGVYYYTLRTPEKTLTKKMVLVK